MSYASGSTSLFVLPNGAKMTDTITGGEYDGMWVNGEREGKGRFRFKGTDFKVRWAGQRRENVGAPRTPPPQVYDGEWSENAPNGTGKLVWRNGSTFVGVFKNGYMWGPGTYDHVDDAGGTR